MTQCAAKAGCSVDSNGRNRIQWRQGAKGEEAEKEEEEEGAFIFSERSGGFLYLDSAHAHPTFLH